MNLQSTSSISKQHEPIGFNILLHSVVLQLNSKDLSVNSIQATSNDYTILLSDFDRDMQNAEIFNSDFLAFNSDLIDFMVKNKLSEATISRIFKGHLFTLHFNIVKNLYHLNYEFVEPFHQKELLCKTAPSFLLIGKVKIQANDQSQNEHFKSIPLKILLALKEYIKPERKTDSLSIKVFVPNGKYNATLDIGLNNNLSAFFSPDKELYDYDPDGEIGIIGTEGKNICRLYKYSAQKSLTMFVISRIDFKHEIDEKLFEKKLSRIYNAIINYNQSITNPGSNQLNHALYESTGQKSFVDNKDYNSLTPVIGSESFATLIHSEDGYIHNLTHNLKQKYTNLKKDGNVFSFFEELGFQSATIRHHYSEKKDFQIENDRTLLSIYIEPIDNHHDKRWFTVIHFGIPGQTNDYLSLTKQGFNFRIISRKLADWTYAFTYNVAISRFELDWTDNYDKTKYAFDNPSDFTEINKYLSIVHPDDHHLIMEKVGKLSLGKSISLLYRLFTKSGKYIWIKDDVWIVNSLEDGRFMYYGAVKDITGDIERQNELNLLWHSVNHLASPLFILNDKTHIEYVNESISNYGFEPDKLIGLPINDLFSYPDPQKNLLQIIESAVKDTSTLIEKLPIELGNKTKLTFMVGVNLLSFSTEDTQKFIITMQDITKVNELEQHLFRKDKLHSLGLMAEGIAHDFNNILQIIATHTELTAIQVQKNENTIKNLQSIESARERGTKLVKCLLEFSREEKYKLDIFDLNEVLSESLELIKELVPKRIDFSFRLDESCNVLIHPTGLQQVLVNLVLNAVQAIGDQKGKVEIFTTVLRKNNLMPVVSKVVSYAEIHVKDSGVGIEKENLSKIFDPHFTTKNNIGGTGIGLAIVNRIILDFNGSVRVNSEPGHGTVFTITLPNI